MRKGLLGILCVGVGLWGASHAAAQSYGETLPDGTYSIQGVWRFESDATDASGNGNNGSGTGLSYTTGIFGNAVEFNAATDTINIGSDASLTNIWDNGGTLACWLRIDSAGSSNSFGRIFAKDTPGSGAYLYVRDLTGGTVTVRFYVYFDGNNAQWSWTGVPTGTWQYFVLVYNDSSTSNDPTLYLDGEEYSGRTEDSTPTGTRDSDAGNTAYIGNRPAGDRGFDGLMDEFILYDRALSGAEISQVYAVRHGVYGSSD